MLSHTSFPASFVVNLSHERRMLQSLQVLASLFHRSLPAVSMPSFCAILAQKRGKFPAKCPGVKKVIEV